LTLALDGSEWSASCPCNLKSLVAYCSVTHAGIVINGNVTYWGFCDWSEEEAVAIFAVTVVVVVIISVAVVTR